jgi:hypothetical protein
MSVLTVATRLNIPEGGVLHIHRRESLKSYEKHSDLVNKPIQFFSHKRDAFKIENKIMYHATTTDTSLLTASYLI